VSFFSDMGDLAAEFFASDMFADATLTRQGGTGSHDPITGAVAALGSSTVACRAVAELITTKAQSGALVSHTRLTLSVEPKEGDKLTLGGKTYIVGEVSMEAPDGNPLVYYAVAKR